MNMSHTGKNAMKYIGSAMAVGGTVMMAGGMLSANSSLKKKAKKTASKAIDAIDHIVTGMQDIIG